MADKEATAVAKAASSPAAAIAVKKTGLKSTKPKAMHPSTAEMVVAAVTALKERNGSSLQAIKKYIAGTYMLDTDRFAPYIRRQIKVAVLSGILVQTKGKGASGSFKLVSGKSETAKTKKTATKAAVTKKAASPKKPVAAKKPAVGKKPESAAKTSKKPVAAKKAAPKKPAAAEKTKKAPAAKPAATKAAKSPSKVKKVSKAPTTKPKAPKPKNIAAPKNAPKKAAAKK